MAKKILIVEKDTSTINSLTWFFSSLEYETIVTHKWPHSIAEDEIIAVFVNVELPGVQTEELLKSFAQDDHVQRIPLFFIFERSYAPRFLAAQPLPHAAQFKKPIRLNELLSVLKHHLHCEINLGRRYTDQQIIAEFKDFMSNFKEWLDKLEDFIRVNGEAS